MAKKRKGGKRAGTKKLKKQDRRTKQQDEQPTAGATVAAKPAEGADRRVRRLEQQLAALEAQVADLVPLAEPSTDPAADGVPADGAPAPAATSGATRAADGWAVAQVRGHLGGRGGVVLAGEVDLRSGTVEGQRHRSTPRLLDRSWDLAADPLAALAHPVRIDLLRHVLRGADTTAALVRLHQVGTTGQLYHHLRRLIAAGWLRQVARGRYEVPADRIVPLLAIIAAVTS